MAKMEQLELLNSEHISENIDARKVVLYGYDPDAEDWRRIAVNADGKLKVAT